jgi:hypothetical protein
MYELVTNARYPLLYILTAWRLFGNIINFPNSHMTFTMHKYFSYMKTETYGFSEMFITLNKTAQCYI